MNSGAIAQGHGKTVGEEADENVRLDSPFDLVKDRTNAGDCNGNCVNGVKLPIVLIDVAVPRKLE